MCNPAIALPAIGILASGAGAAINTIQNNKFQKAAFEAEENRQAIERAAREAEAARQRVIDDQSFSEVREALTAIDPAERAKLVEIEAMAPDNAIQTAGDRYDPLPRSTDVSGEVLGDAGKLRDEASRVKEQIAAMAVLSAQGNTQDSAVRRLQALGQNTADLRSKGRRSASVADFEAAVPAAKVTPRNGILGDLLLGGGQIASGFGGQAFGASGASPASALVSPNLFKNLAGG